MLLSNDLHNPHVLVVDFGIADVCTAKATSSEEEDTGATCRFGGAEALEDGNPGGSPGYMPPEMWVAILGQGAGFGSKVDVYAMGVVLFIFMSGGFFPWVPKEFDEEPGRKSMQALAPAYLVHAHVVVVIDGERSRG